MSDIWAEIQADWRADLKSGAVFKETAESFFARHKVAKKRATPLTMMDIIMETAEEFGVSRAAVLGASRAANSVRPRFAAIWLIREKLSERTLTEIGRKFNRDHTSIMHAVTRAGEMLDRDQDFKAAVDRIKVAL